MRRHSLLPLPLLALALLGAPASAVAQPPDVSAPVPKSHVDAQYPESALKEGKHAQVVLLVTVDTTGHVANVTVAESGGPDAAPQKLTSVIEARGGAVLNIDHWGRRRLAYPIGRNLDADYVISRINFEPADVNALEAALRIDETVLRHLIVRADELPVPPPPREPRGRPARRWPRPRAAGRGARRDRSRRRRRRPRRRAS